MITIKHQKGAEKYTVDILAKLNNPAFIEDSKRVTLFDPEFTDPYTITGFDILSPLINTTTEKLNIGFYTQKWLAYRFVPVNGYVDPTGRNMFLNRRNLWRGFKEIEETIWHELVHVSDAINLNAMYWHGDNDLAGKDKTAPVVFAKWAADWKLPFVLNV